MNVATCAVGGCDECALRQIEASVLSQHSCGGGIDMRDFRFHTPCAACYEVLYPAAQDWQNAELDAFFVSSKVAKDVIESDSTSVLMEEDEGVNLVKDEVEYAKHKCNWANIHLAPVLKKTVGGATFQYYKPFKRPPSPLLKLHEIEDYQGFLEIIF